MDDYARRLELSDSLRGPVIRSAIRALDLPPGSRGLDVGCGIGSHIPLLAEAVGPEGRVTGLDRSAEFLVEARRRCSASCGQGRTDFQQGDMTRLPFESDAFDWVFSVDCAGYAPVGEPAGLVRELARVVRPGGRIALLAWSSQQLLPGYPDLEARLNATAQGIAPFRKGDPPERHFMRAPVWFEEAGLSRIGSATFVGDVRSPLSPLLRDAVASLFEMRWGGPEDELPERDGALFRRLCRPGSPECILNAPGYYAFFTYSLFHAGVPA